MKRSIGFVVFGLFLGVATPAPAQAQTGGAFGIGPRVTFQRGDDAVPDSSALRVFGGQMKLRLNPSTTIEISADYDTTVDESLSQRSKSMPIQASLLVFPFRTAIAPYVLGGIGWYRQSITSNSTTTSVREMGYHAGLGAEMRFGQRMALHGDYRYNHIRFGGNDDSSSSPSTGSGLRIPGLSAIQESLKRSSQGSMWNWGLTFFF